MWSRSLGQVKRLLWVATFVFATASAAAAQTFTGGLRGAVRDPNGVVPGVTVELVNEATAIVRSTVTNDQGEYNFSAVQPGTYTVKATLTGFKTYENTGVRISTQQFITLDVTLEVGQLQETITVTAQAPLIDTSNASTSTVLDSQQLQTLPSAGRSAFLFAVTVPTVVASGDAQFNRQQDQTNASLLSLGGGTRRGNNYLLDGVSTTDLRNRASSMPTMEAIEEVTVQVHTYDAETGRTGGGTFNVATKSGTNNFRGTAFYQGRPSFGLTNNFFSELAGVPKPSTYYHLGGAGVGGPVVRNRTFFWGAFEGYGSNTTRNGALRFPTSRELRGDFSQSFDNAGRLVVIYDPLTGDPVTGAGRTPFPGNVIPQSRINPVAAAMASYLPSPDSDVSNGSANFNRTAEINDRAYMYTGKVDHRFTDTISLTGFYLYNKTDEPCANYWEPGLDGANRFADPGDYILRRRVHTLALNNTWLPSNNTVVTLRYGWNRFIDNNTLSTAFDPATLGLPSSFLNAIQVDKFPQVHVTDYDNVDFSRMMGAIDPVNINWHSWGVNGTVSRLMGRHTLKVGLDYRLIGLDFQSFDNGAGEFRFDKRFTTADPSQNGIAGANPSGNAFASFLLGYPSGSGTLSSVGVSTPLELYTNYYGAYIQDDFRANSKLTLNYGLRVEHEDGLRERNDLITVAFDRTLNPGGALGNVVNPLTGQRIVGGLVYAGVNGANDYQGNPPGLKVSPRLGAVYSINPRTVIRSGYGLYWAPWNYQAPNNTNYGQIGASQVTEVSQNNFFPTVSLNNPFPAGLRQPVGNAQGALTGVGGTINFIDQDKTAPKVHMYSVDINRELPNNIAIGFEYAGATGRDLGLGGSNDGIVNINQVPTQYLALGAALNDNVANPFFGLPAGQGFNVGSSTIPRRQLLRPFPQFGDILMRQSTLGRNQYHAAILKFEKRMSNGWGGRVNYTWSRLEDNQFGEGNFFSRNSTEAADANNIDAEYGIGILDVPHKIVVTPMFELPFGEGKRWAQSGIANAILGDWVLSSIISIESGFPVSLSANSNDLENLGYRMQRVNLGAGELATDGSAYDRIAPPSGASCVTGQQCGTGIWLRDGVAIDPVGFVLGTAPRNLADVRTPMRNNWDFSASKDIGLGGALRGQFKIEVLNITNTPKVRGPISTVGSSTFGQIRVQSGFMRLTQFSFRMSF